MSASLIITNASILTMDRANPRAEAIAISGNRISHLGRHADVMVEKGPHTRIIDAQGGSVLAGILDRQVAELQRPGPRRSLRRHAPSQPLEHADMF